MSVWKDSMPPHQFIDTRHMFPDHATLFYLTRMDRCHLDEILKPVQESKTNAETQSVIQALVERLRPELKNCLVLSLSFESTRCNWEMLVSHPSLPAVTFGMDIRREPLVPPVPEIEESWLDRNPLL